MAGPFTNETENFSRLVLLINEKGAEAFRESLLHFSTRKYGVGTFDDVLNDVTAKTILQSLKGPGRGKPITAHQWLILYPGTGTAVDVSQLDITLCLVLLRNICGLVEPLTTWDRPPAPGDNSLEGGLAQVKSIRNFISHSKEPKLSDADFNTNFRNACDAILNIEQNLPTWSTTQIELNQFQRLPISPTLHADLSNIVKEWAQQDSNLKDEISTVKNEIGNLAREISGVKIQVSDVAQEGSGVKKKVGKVAKEVSGVKTRVVKVDRKVSGVHSRVSKVAKEVSIVKTDINQTVSILNNELLAALLLQQMERNAPVISDTIPPDFVLKLQKALKEYYQQEMSEIRCNPLDPDATQPIEDSFVNLSMVKEYVNYSPLQEKEVTPLRHYRDLFIHRSDSKKVFRILIHGKPGIGKTTLTKRLAVDWAEDKEKELSERFEIVFALTLRKVTKGQTLVDVIAEQLLSQESPLIPKLKSYIENNDKCLFIFDGLDEMTKNTSTEIDKMIKRNYLRNTCLIITSRPSQAQHLMTTTKIDQHARIEGFTLKDVKCFIEKFYGEKIVEEFESDDEYFDSEERHNIGYGLYQEIQKNNLVDIASIPLILNILCLLYRQSKVLPDNMSKIYQRLQDILCKRKKDDDSEVEAHLEDILKKLGKFALEGLLKEENQLFFCKKDILEEIGEDAFRVGLIWTEKAKYELEANTQVFYLHKSFQEKIAAFYVGREFDNGNDEPWCKLKARLQTVAAIYDHDLLLQFCAGASNLLADKILDLLDEKVFKIDARWENVLQAMDQLSQNTKLSTKELETVAEYKMDFDVTKVLNLEASCLLNMENPHMIKPHVCNRFIEDAKIVKKAFQRKILKPADNCIVSVQSDEELECLAKGTNAVSWINMEFLLKESTVHCLQEILDKNKCTIAVILGPKSACYMPTICQIMELLKDHEKVCYIGLQTNINPCTGHGKALDVISDSLDSTSINTKERWNSFFDRLLGTRYLISLNVQSSDIPYTVLEHIGTFLNQNANNFLKLELGGNDNIKSHLASMTQKIKRTLSLRILNLGFCLENSDTQALKNLLWRCKEIKELNVSFCHCEVSSDILELRSLTNLTISGTVDEKGQGLNVTLIIENLDKFRVLEVLDADGCNIDDEVMQKISFKNPSKLKEISLNFNPIDVGFLYLCIHYRMLQDLRRISLFQNRIGDETGRTLLRYLYRFNKGTSVVLLKSRMSSDVKDQLEEQAKLNNIWIFCNPVL